MILNLDNDQIFDILVSLKNRRASLITICDECASESISYSCFDPLRKFYDDRFERFNSIVKRLDTLISFLENSCI